jgi:putative intracellular protease/amidase
MGKILCFISEEFADFEITLVFHKNRNVGKKDVVTVGYSHDVVVSESGLHYKPAYTLEEVIKSNDIEGLIIPGGPIRNQQRELTELIIKLNDEKKMLAAICNGPQYLGRTGILKECKFTTSCSLDNISRLGVEDPFPRENYVESRVVTDKNIITAKGRAFVDFSFAIFDYLDIYKGQYSEKEKLFRDIMDR